MRMREAEVAAAVTTYVEARGYSVLTEYPLVGKIADVFGAMETQGKSIAVECKERDWRRGLEQARRYQVAADDVYLALPEQAVTEELAREATRVGVGLLVVLAESEVKLMVDPRRAAHFVPELKERALAQFAQRSRDRG